jgi:hypothetical protein
MCVLAYTRARMHVCKQAGGSAHARKRESSLTHLVGASTWMGSFAFSWSRDMRQGNKRRRGGAGRSGAAAEVRPRRDPPSNLIDKRNATYRGPLREGWHVSCCRASRWRNCIFARAPAPHTHPYTRCCCPAGRWLPPTFTGHNLADANVPSWPLSHAHAANTRAPLRATHVVVELQQPDGNLMRRSRVRV